MADEELIDGVYKLVMCIATGGSSQVWEVIEQQSGWHLAMKLLKMDSPDYKENKANLKYEADVLKTLDHPMIIKFDKYSSSRDNTYMTMDHFRAANVKLQIKSDISSVHVRARRLFEGVCSAMSHVHSKGWIHRDLKPDNVLMNKVGEIRLVDFSLTSKEVKGFSKLIGGGKLKTIQGTRTYIAPETILKQAPTFQTDLYSLGIMFFEVLTGKTPFQAPTPEELLKKHLRVEPPNASEFNTNVTSEMDRLITRLLKKKPSDRHGSIDEVLSELKRIKIFKEDVTEESLAKIEADKKGDAMSQLTDIRLDSRADVQLRETLAANPELARQYAIDKQAKADKKKNVEEERKAKILKSNAAKPAPAPVPPTPMQQMQVQMNQMQQHMQQMQLPPNMPPGYPPGYAPYPQVAQPGLPPGYPNPLSPGMMPAIAVDPARVAMAPMQGVPAAPPRPAIQQSPATPTAPGTTQVATPATPTVAAQATARSPANTPAPSAAPPQSLRPSSPAAVPSSATPTRPATPTAATVKAAPVKPAPTPVAAPANADVDELEFMTELPDVL